jgi:hypothetical protein
MTTLRTPDFLATVWLSALRAAGRSPRTIDHYTYCARARGEWRSTTDDLSTVTRLEALAYVRHHTDDRAPAGALSPPFDQSAVWLVAEEIIERNPSARNHDQGSRRSATDCVGRGGRSGTTSSRVHILNLNSRVSRRCAKRSSWCTSPG